MKAYLAKVLIIDHENYGKDDALMSLEQLRHWHPTVVSCEEADIGEWNDDHPLNSHSTMQSECEKLFPSQSKIYEVIVWVDYSSMDKYPREVYLTIEAARNKASRLLGFDLNDPTCENYDEGIADEWDLFEKGLQTFTYDDCEFEFHRVKVK